MRRINKCDFKILLLALTCSIISRCNHQPDICDTNNYTINYDISGQLVERFTQKPVKDQLIKLFGSGPYIYNYQMKEVVTDDSGYFAISGTSSCPSPAPQYLQLDGNEWRCTMQFNYSASLFEIPPMAYVAMNLHRIDSNVPFDSLVVSAGCCCALPKVRLFSSNLFTSDTIVLKPIGGDQIQTLFWYKYENNQVIDKDSFDIDIPGIDTVGAAISF